MKIMFILIAVAIPLLLFSGCKPENDPLLSSIPSLASENPIADDHTNAEDDLHGYVETFPHYQFEGKRERGKVQLRTDIFV